MPRIGTRYRWIGIGARISGYSVSIGPSTICLKIWLKDGFVKIGGH